MKTIIILISALICQFSVQAQFVTRNGYISFQSKTPLENITAENKQVYSSIDIEKQHLSFVLLMKGFLFKKQLMQQHFNENYVESDKYPKANFAGQYSGMIDPSKNGTYKIRAKGNITIHGVTKEIEVPANITVLEGKMTALSMFTLRPRDFAIKVPAVVRDKIAEMVEVYVSASFQTLK